MLKIRPSALLWRGGGGQDKYHHMLMDYGLRVIDLMES